MNRSLGEGEETEKGSSHYQFPDHCAIYRNIFGFENDSLLSSGLFEAESYMKFGISGRINTQELAHSAKKKSKTNFSPQKSGTLGTETIEASKRGNYLEREVVKIVPKKSNTNDS